jgi:hypothetical protein
MRFQELTPLKEGIKISYDKEKVEQYLRKAGFSQGDYRFDTDNRLTLDIKLSHRSKYSTVVKNLENVFGWWLIGAKEDLFSPISQEIEGEPLASFVNSIEAGLEIADSEGEDDDDEFGSLHFEAKYSQTIESDKLPNTVYHVTDKSLVPKIQKQGLVPKAGSKKTKHPERIYLFLNQKNIAGLLDDTDFYIRSAVVLTINISNFKNTTKFFIDPFLEEGGVYVLKNIPPNLIIDYKKYQYD